MMRKSEWIIGLAFVTTMALLPLVGHWSRQGMEHTCAYDGGVIDPRYRVRVVDAHGKPSEFCCVRCAELWLKSVGAAPGSIFVTDEESGMEIDAAAATFVRSLVVTTRTTGNRIHVFQESSDAHAHARAFGGTVLDDDARPFR